MGGELEVAVTDAQREAALAHLRRAVATSSIDLEVFAEAMGAVLSARTGVDVAVVLQQVAPAVRMTPSHRRLDEPAVFEVRSGRLTLEAAWQVARETVVVCTSGRVVLDLTAAEFDAAEVDLDLSSQSGSIEVIVPDVVDVQFVEMTSHSGSVVNALGTATALPSAPLVRVRARTTSGRITVRLPAPPKPPKPRWWRRRRAAQPTATAY